MLVGGVARVCVSLLTHSTQHSNPAHYSCRRPSRLYLIDWSVRDLGPTCAIPILWECSSLERGFTRQSLKGVDHVAIRSNNESVGHPGFGNNSVRSDCNGLRRLSDVRSVIGVRGAVLCGTRDVGNRDANGSCGTRSGGHPNPLSECLPGTHGAAAVLRSGSAVSCSGAELRPAK